MSSYTWLAYCQQCELKKPFARYTDRDRWVATHRTDTGHRVESGAGKPPPREEQESA